MKRSLLAPKPELIRSRVARDWSPHSAIAEFVDNSLAQNKGGASEVYVEVGPGYVEVTDHGMGCDDINRLFCLGDSSSFADRTDIGLYGVGATDACIWLGSRQIVETVRGGRLFRMEHTWETSRPRWPRSYRGRGDVVPDDHPLAAGGTRIRIEGLRRGRTLHVEKLIADLGRLFAPGLLQDKSIHVRRGKRSQWTRVQPFEGPALDRQHSVRWTGDVEGKKFFAEIGWMNPPKPEFNCLHVAFQHRLIERTSDFFIEKRSGLITGWLYLSGEWKYDLEDHKGCLVRGPDRDRLMRQIYDRVLPLIEMAEQQERHVALEKLAARLNESLRRVTVAGRDGHTQTGETAAHEMSEAPSSRESTRATRGRRTTPGADADTAGDRRTARNTTGISIGWFQDPEHRMLVQTREEAGHLRVLFNTEHPEIAKATADPGNHFGLISTALRCVSHLLLEWSDDRRKRAVPTFDLSTTVTRVEAADALYSFLMRDLHFTRKGQMAHASSLSISP